MADRELVTLLVRIIADAQHALAIVEGNVGNPMPPTEPNPDVSLGFYGLTLEKSKDRVKWELVNARHLPGSENQGKHNIYVYAYDEYGKRDANPALHIGWTWEGRQPFEAAPPAKLDKRAGEAHGNIPIERNQKISLWLEGDGAGSDIVHGMHTKWPQDGPGNSLFHHSFELSFRKRKA